MNERMKRFIDFYLESGDGRESAIKAGYAPESAVKVAKRLLERADVQEKLSKPNHTKGLVTSIKPIVSDVWIIDNLKAIVNDDTAPHASRVSALSQIAKMLGFDRPKQFVSFEAVSESHDERIKAVIEGVVLGNLDLGLGREVIEFLAVARNSVGEDSSMPYPNQEELDSIFSKAMYEMAMKEREVKQRRVMEEVNARLDREEQENDH